MRLKSFTTVAFRIIGVMSIIYGIMTLIFILITMFMIPGMGSGMGMPGMGAMIWLQLMLPILMCVLGLILIAVSRPLANALSKGLED